MTRLRILTLLILTGSFLSATAQPDRWQQRVEYTMNINFNVKNHRFTGTQKLVYYNNSPDTLNRVFYHLYFNAFQPNSMMDVRSRTIKDPDRRVGSRIAALKDNEIGYHRINSLKQNGKPLQYETVGTILEVELADPILPGQQATFDMEFDSQVPTQIRRSGRNNAEGISYSMAQWYPKMAEYDYQGWHAHPYIGREFYGVWGDFDVTINIDKNFVIGATGYLQNPEEIGHGYETPGMTVKPPKGDELSWHFVAPNVHDFVWAADPEYKHTTRQTSFGTVLHFFYQENEKTKETWSRLPDVMEAAMDFGNRTFGKYPYEQYSFIQGGDGGMEYPMATLIVGEGSMTGLASVSIHEMFHSWYQMILGTNESLYAWMDEGFTEYAEETTKQYLQTKGLYPGNAESDPHADAYAAYRQLALSGVEEPLSTHADHFVTNYAYSRAAYTKGHVFLNQLKYVVGEEAFNKGMLRYFDEWKFKHPNANDFIRIMEKQSGLELDWYKEYMVNSTHFVDYAIDTLQSTSNNQTQVTLARIGVMPMPIDVVVTYQDGSKELFTIPLQIMRGAKKQEFTDMKFTVLEDWPWTHPTYNFTIPVPMTTIEKLEIDPSHRLADLEKANNTWGILIGHKR